MADNTLRKSDNLASHPEPKPGPPFAQAAGRLRSLASHRPHVWLTIAMVLLGAALHYLPPFSYPSETSPLQLPNHTMHRIFFMVPVAYAGFIFGPRGGFITLLAVVPLMLPRALVISSNPTSAIVEILSIVVVSGLIVLWFGGQQSEKERRYEILSRLELARQELASQVEVIRKNERRLAALNGVCCTVAGSLELPRILQEILGKVVEEMGVSAAMIFLKDEATRRLEMVAHQGVSEEFARAVTTLRVGEGFNGRVAQSGEAMAIENCAEDPRLAVPQVVKEGIHSQLIVPLQSRGATIGTLCAATHSKRSFSTDDRELLTAIGSQVGIAIENARLFQKALTSEESYRDLFENATVAIFVQDLGGTIVAANKASATLTGYPLTELMSANVDQLFPPQAFAALTRVEQQLFQGEDRLQAFDLPLARKDGAESIVSMTTRLVKENGQPKGFQHIAIDVTERRRMRDALNYYMRQVLDAQEEERKRIARELHDETAQSLLLILQRMDTLTYVPGREFSHVAERELEDLRAVVLQALSDLRRITRDLRPQILDDLGLVAAMEWLAEETERQSGIKISVEVAGTRRELAPELQLLLFRIAQEALSNVRRHSAASSARVVMEYADGRVRVTVEDNGQGFQVPGSLSDLANGGKLGIVGMSERARLAGGSITVESEPGRGTRVVAELGVSAPSRDA